MQTLRGLHGVERGRGRPGLQERLLGVLPVGGANSGGGDGAGGHRKSRCEPQGVDGER